MTRKKHFSTGIIVFLSLVLAVIPILPGFSYVDNSPVGAGSSNVNQNGNNNEVLNDNTSSANINFSNQNNTLPGLLNPAGGVVNTVIGSPSAFSNTHLFNGPWNFTPPHLLFHPSKTINDGSIFTNCRIIAPAAQLKRRFKDYVFGVYDEASFVASRTGRPNRQPAASQVIACGLNTNIPPGCANYIGTAYVFLEEYSTTEAALVALSRLASENGANLLGNVNCTFSETIRSYGVGAGLSLGYSENIASKKDPGILGTSVGGSWSGSRVKRPVQPHCSADAYTATMGGCYAKAAVQPVYLVQPVTYNTYVPAPQPAPPVVQEPVRGLW